MANLLEIFDPTKLAYDATLGFVDIEMPGEPTVVYDVGSGPPTVALGWVRTGAPASTSFIAGVANCNLWTSTTPGEAGTVATLSLSSFPGTTIGPWTLQAVGCGASTHVWCVEDARDLK